MQVQNQRTLLNQVNPFLFSLYFFLRVIPDQGIFNPYQHRHSIVPYKAILGIMIVMTIGQLIENYILTPLIIGKKVALNGFFTIIIIILGGAIWGVLGMIVAIPFLGTTKILLDHTEDIIKAATSAAFLMS